MSNDAEASSRSSFRSDNIQSWPLTTTVHTIPGECTSVFDIDLLVNTPPTAELALGHHYHTTCWIHPPHQGYNTFSPGLACPAGWTSALTQLNSKLYQGTGWVEYIPTGAFESAFARSRFDYLLRDETMVLCCPTYA